MNGTTFDISQVSTPVFQGVGMAIIAGTAMRTIDIVERGAGKRQPRRRARAKPRTIKQYKLNLPKTKYRYRY